MHDGEPGRRDRTRRDRSGTLFTLICGGGSSERRRFFVFLSHDAPSPLFHLDGLLPAMSAILYRQYTGESDLPCIMALVQHELSEPYVIYTYRYFLHQWYVTASIVCHFAC